MKVSNKDILTAISALNLLQQERMSPKLGLRLARMHRTLSGPAEDYRAVRKGLIDQYALKDESGQYVTREGGERIEFGENEEAAADANEELLETTVDVRIRKLTEAELTELKDVPLAAVYGLEPFIG